MQRIRKLDLKKVAEHQRDARLGEGADAAQRRHARRASWSTTRSSVDPQVRGRHPQGAAGAEGVPASAAGEAQAAPRATTRTSCTSRGAAPWTPRSSSSRRCCATTACACRWPRRMDAFRALDAVGLGDRETVRGALRATMVKRAVDVPTFDELFDLYFSGLGEVIREVTARDAGRARARRGRLPALPGAARGAAARSRASSSRRWRRRCCGPTPAGSSSCCARPPRQAQLGEHRARVPGGAVHATRMAAALGLGELGARARATQARPGRRARRPTSARQLERVPRPPPARPAAT